MPAAPAPVGIPTFGEWAVTFLFAYYPDPPPPKPPRAEHRLLLRPVARWNTKRLDKVLRTDLETYFRERERVAKPGTLERERRLLKRLFQAACDDGLILVNPVKGVRRFHAEARTRVLTPEEEAAILAVCPPKWARWVQVGLKTGLRLNEQLQLRPIDLVEKGGHRWIAVRPESNKTRKGRLVPLRPDVEAILRTQAEETGLRLEDDRFWYQTDNAVKQAMRKAWIRAKIPRFSCHDLRRTFASRCAEAGMNPKHLQTILGHQSIEVTYRYYVHANEDAVASALAGLSL